ncbi:hypothetical protein Tsubulata_021825 [Turnera subulata]|uniref:Glutaredoxin domain-containing protein n=1 Tax=Turnera subulata TaxID=218843 RepID=A0A9Q0GCH8_9ROSI|nr:hypothetical protein Tsubulata_021825 [Turnera subulata]
MSKSKPPSTTVIPDSYKFNRSLTIHSSSIAKPYYQSTSRFYNSFENMKGKVKKLRNLFETPKPPKPGPVEPPQPQLQIQPSNKLRVARSFGPEYNRFSSGSHIRLPGTEDRVVVYFTSLRGVRRTFEDCYAVRMIFRGFRLWVDERDVSMDAEYRKELQNVMGEKRTVSLPQVFIRGRHFGGADTIKQMFETGELARVLEGFPRRAPGFVCEACGDVRFIPCVNCSGSRKLFDEDEGVIKRCLECNENGLIRCPDCR